jgi:REP element-mobilizing transposase RayT
MPDHLHLLVGLRPDTSLSDLMRTVKSGFIKIYQREPVGKREVLLAGRIWCIFVFQITTGHCH